MSDLLSLSEDQRSRLQGALMPGEVVRWAGASNPPAAAAGVRRFTPWLQIAFGLGIVATGQVIRYNASPGGDPSLGFEFPLAFALIGGVAVVLGLFDLLAQARRRARMLAQVHAVTSKRVLSLDGAKTLAIEARQLRYAYAFDGKDGSGDLHLDHQPAGASPDDVEESLALRDIPRVAAAMRAVQRLAAEHGVDISDTADEHEPESDDAPPVASRSHLA